MKKLLPILFFIPFFISLLLCSIQPAFAQVGAAAPTITVTPSSNRNDGAWVEDPDVTFAGKLAARASKTLSWILAHPQWIESGSSNSISGFWVVIRNIVYVVLALFVIVTAFVLIVTRGKSIAARRFLPRFIFAAILITLSFSLIQFLYQITDIIQGWFLRVDVGTANARPIEARDLLNIAFNYDAFQGFRRIGFRYDESAFISLILVKLTAITFYIMAGVLIVRKIILWFFIAVSPVFPLLLFYYPLRNSAKIWIGEFFRWLLYGPLFAIFLFALVSIWKNGGLPLFFGPDVKDNNAYKTCDDLTQAGIDCYPIAINILLGGPGQTVGYREGTDAYQNSVNSPSRFGLYVAALIMLWVVIVLPFILLQIFLDYFFSYASNESSIINKIINKGSNILKPPPGPVSPPANHGQARVFFREPSPAPVPPPTPIPPPATTGRAREIPIATSTTRLSSVEQTKSLLNSMNVTVPTIRDVARFETSALTHEIERHEEIARNHETLEKIAKPTIIQNPIERQQFTSLRNTLVKQQEAGNPLAHAILSASQMSSATQGISQTNIMRETLEKLASPQIVSNTAERQMFENISKQVIEEEQKGNPLATTIKNAISTVNMTQDLQLNKVLQQVANPQTASVTEREKLTEIHDTLVKEASQGNSLATTISSAIKMISQNTIAHVQKVIERIVKPETVTKSAEKERYVDLHDTVVQEAQKGNVIAQSVLSVAKSNSQTEIESFHNQLVEAKQKGDTLATTILSIVNKEVASDTTNTSTINNVQQMLSEAQQKGDPLATAILSVVQPGATTTVEEVREKLVEAKQKGDPLAKSLLSTIEKQEQQVAAPSQFPVANRVQQVSLEDYEAVKKMWQENYQKLDAPRNMDRKQWLQRDVSAIQQTINLLLSSDQSKNKEGMSNVSSILPFLLIGGFSQSEVIAYLKAKQEAAKEVLSDMEKKEEEEETKVDTQKKQEQKPKEMSMEAEEPVQNSQQQNENT